jgi:hypothetical protein
MVADTVTGRICWFQISSYDHHSDRVKAKAELSLAGLGSLSS